MANETVLIGCRLPHGLTLTIREPITKEGQPGAVISKVTIKGVNSSKIIGATHVTTPVDAEFWASWKKTFPKFKALKNGAIFEAKTVDQADYKAKELEKSKVKTGFEKMSQTDMSVKPANKD